MGFEEIIFPTNIALTPNEILKRWENLTDKFGLAVITADKRFKRAREVYAAAVYAVGLTAKTGVFYWVSPGKKNETPDAYLIWKDTNKDNHLCVECVEIVQWEKNVDDLLKVIKKKISKAYPANFVILIHIERPGDYLKAEYFGKIRAFLKNIKISSGAVRMWMPISKGEKDCLIGELYPEDNYTEFPMKHFLGLYNLFPEIIKIDLTSGRKRALLEKAKLPDLSGLE